MQQYELLFILPGTLTEEEVRPIAEAVKQAVEAQGGTDITMQDKGKSRLAYPMKHIRYGYFHLCYFTAEPEAIPEIEKKLRLMTQLLRTVLRKADKDKVGVESITAISDVTIREPRSPRQAPAETEEKKAPVETAEEAARKVDTPAPEAKPTKEAKTETKAEDVKMEEIDKKLDELLETDIADV